MGHLAKADIVELKTLRTPPVGVVLTMEVICILMQVPPVKLKDGAVDYWRPAKALLGDPTFLKKVSTLRDHDVPASVLDAVAPYMSHEDFTPESLHKVSKACCGLCAYARQVYKYHVLGHASAEARRQQIACTPVAEVLVNMQAAIASVPIGDLQELKSMSKPPSSLNVLAACLLHLFASIAPEIDLTKNGYPKDLSWKAFQKFCSNPTAVVQRLKDFQAAVDAGMVPRRNFWKARKIHINLGKALTPDVMKKKSVAAGGLCSWLIYALAYYDQTAPKEVAPRSPTLDTPSLPVGTPMDCLSKCDITELKCLIKPPAGVKLTMEVICVLMQVEPVTVQLENETVADYWATSKALLADVNFMQRIIALRDHVSESALDAAAPYMSRDDFNPEPVGKTSLACKGLCKYAREVYKHHRP